MTLEEMLAKREELRAEEVRITKKIMAERKRINEKNRKPLESKRSLEEVNRMADEIRELRGIVVLTLRADEKTYSEIGKLIGVSSGRVRDIFQERIRHYGRMLYETKV